MTHYRWQRGDLILRCQLQPQASHSEFAGLHNQRLKIRIAAPPVDGKANKALIDFLSRQFAVPKSRIEIVKGENSRQKTVKILNPSALPPECAVKQSAN